MLRSRPARGCTFRGGFLFFSFFCSFVLGVCLPFAHSSRPKRAHAQVTIPSQPTCAQGRLSPGQGGASRPRRVGPRPTQMRALSWIGPVRSCEDAGLGATEAGTGLALERSALRPQPERRIRSDRIASERCAPEPRSASRASANPTRPSVQGRPPSRAIPIERQSFGSLPFSRLSLAFPALAMAQHATLGCDQRGARQEQDIHTARFLT